jgi:hypothetical protein
MKQQKQQHYKNHRRIIPLYHGFVFFSTLALLIGSFVNLGKSLGDESKVYSASLICLISVIMIMMFFFTRIFALRAQDRAIRAEQNLRYFVLAGKLLPGELGIRQIIALRFAPDEEFPGLVEKTVTEGLSPDRIKREIRNWQGDFHRV